MSIYGDLGIEPIINACGTVTRLGGAPMHPQVLAAWQQAATQWVPLEGLQAVASRRIATATGTEAGLVTCGSAAALTLGAAAILVGHDLGRMQQLPDCGGFANQLIIAREQRSGYDHAVRASGARLVEVGMNEIVAGAGVRRTELWEYEAAISDQTAGLVYVQTADSRPALPEVVRLAQRYSLPVLVDAAGELPPRENLRSIPATGADLVAFSGGKAIRGPQSTGMLCGRRDLISSAALQMLDMDDHFELWDPPPELLDRSQLTGHPRHGIGRALKVSKEELVALLTALELFTSGAYDKQIAQFRVWLESIVRELAACPVACRITDPQAADQWPILEIHLQTPSRPALEVCRSLRQGQPPIFVGHAKLHDEILTINPLCLSDEDACTLARSIRAQLS